MRKLVVIGVGDHSRRYHLPSLSHYVSQYPGRFELTAVCDIDGAKAKLEAERFGFLRSYSDLDEMLRVEKPAACVAVTPVSLNATVGHKLLSLGIPSLIEKPPGATIAEAEQLARECEKRAGRLMVSVNRRFEPTRQATLAWIGARPIHAVRILMSRHARRDLRFLQETGIHVVDALGSFMGSPVRCSATRTEVDGGQWWHSDLRYASGAIAHLDLTPTAGASAERFEFYGAGFRAECYNAESDLGGWRAWEEGRLVKEEFLPSTTPQFIANGTYRETEAFLEAVLGAGPFWPTPSDVLGSMRVLESIEDAAK